MGTISKILRPKITGTTTAFLLIIACLLSFVQPSRAQQYTKVRSGYIMVLRQGENVINALEQFAVKENIPSANFTGMGFVNMTFGYFNFSTKQYTPRDFNRVELTSMHGSIAWKEGKPSIHAHGVIGNQSFESYSGHILKATVSTGSVEVLIVVHDKRLERKKDEQLGADVLEIPAH